MEAPPTTRTGPDAAAATAGGREESPAETIATLKNNLDERAQRLEAASKTPKLGVSPQPTPPRTAVGSPTASAPSSPRGARARERAVHVDTPARGASPPRREQPSRPPSPPARPMDLEQIFSVPAPASAPAPVPIPDVSFGVPAASFGDARPEDQIASLKRDVARLKAELERLQQEGSLRESFYRVEAARRERLERENEDAGVQLAEARRQAAECEERARDMQRELSNHGLEVMTAKAEMRRLQESNEKLRQEVRHAEQTAREAMERAQLDARERAERLERSYAQRERELDRVRASLEDLAAQVRAAGDEGSSGSSELATSLQQIAAIEADRARLGSENTRLRFELDSRERALATSRQQMRDAEDELVRTRRDCEERLAEVQKRLDDEASRAAVLLNGQTELDLETERLRREVERLQADRVALEETRQRLESTQRELRDQQEMARDALRLARYTDALRKADLGEDARLQIEQLEESNRDLARQLETMRLLYGVRVGRDAALALDLSPVDGLEKAAGTLTVSRLRQAESGVRDARLSYLALVDRKKQVLAAMALADSASQPSARQWLMSKFELVQLLGGRRNLEYNAGLPDAQGYLYFTFETDEDLAFAHDNLREIGVDVRPPPARDLETSVTVRTLGVRFYDPLSAAATSRKRGAEEELLVPLSTNTPEHTVIKLAREHLDRMARPRDAIIGELLTKISRMVGADLLRADERNPESDVIIAFRGPEARSNLEKARRILESVGVRYSDPTARNGASGGGGGLSISGLVVPHRYEPVSGI